MKQKAGVAMVGHRRPILAPAVPGGTGPFLPAYPAVPAGLFSCAPGGAFGLSPAQTHRSHSKLVITAVSVGSGQIRTLPGPPKALPAGGQMLYVYPRFAYSWRRASIGSTRVARRAGMNAASSATAASINTTAEYMMGSLAFMPNNSPLSSLATP
jgi:hypothetical protein